VTIDIYGKVPSMMFSDSGRDSAGRLDWKINLKKGSGMS